MPKCPNCKTMTTRKAKDTPITRIKCSHCKDIWKVYHCSKCDTRFYGCGSCGEITVYS